MSDDQQPIEPVQINAEQAPVAQEQPQEQVEEASVQKEEPKRKDAEFNFSELRKQKEAAIRRAEEAERRANDILELSKQFKGSQNQEQRDLLEEELAKLQPDDLATVSNAEKIYSKHNRSNKKAVEEMQAKVARLEAALEEQSLRAKFPDLDEVLSSENIEALNRDDPEIAMLIGQLPKNSKEQVTMAYKYIKRLVPQKVPDSQDKKKAIENSKKPLSVQAIKASGDSPISLANAFANGPLSKAAAAAFYKDMKDAQKG
jgi:hypothetical protein